MKFVLEEAKSAIQKSQDDMTKYYNQCCIPASVFKHGSKVFLDFLEIYTTCSSAKLFHCYLRPYMIEKQVGLILYHLKLSPTLWRLHSVFHIVKFTAVSEDFIPRRYLKLPLDLVIINGEEEWEVKNILDSYWHRKKY